MLNDELSKIYQKTKDESSVFKICDEKIKPKLMEAAKAGKPSVCFYTARLVELVNNQTDTPFGFDDWVKKEGLSIYVGNTVSEIFGWDKHYKPQRHYSDPLDALFRLVLM